MKKLEEKEFNRIYEGDIIIHNADEWKQIEEKYDVVRGSISMDGCTGLTSVTFPKMRYYIYMDERCSEGLLTTAPEKTIYCISGVRFSKPLFDSVRKGTLTAQQVFAITNIEQRRVAYEKMEKTKMNGLDGLTVLDEKANPANPLRIVAFAINGFSDPFYYLHCKCPSTGREYYLETRQKKCDAAVAASFGLKKVVFDKEW